MSSDAASVPRVTAADLHLRDAVVQELEVRDVKHVVNRISVARAAPDLNRLLTALTRNAAVPEGAIGVEVSRRRGHAHGRGSVLARPRGGRAR